MAITIDDTYFGWICEQIDGIEYHDLLIKLYYYPFIWKDPSDQNREIDGFELRYHFAASVGLEPSFVEFAFASKPCSILEMMVALSFRMESEYMASEHANRVGHWFWNMVDSMGLIDCKDPKLFEKILYDFNSRNYFENGKGGLFYIPGAARDMRRVSIWDQMNAWIIWQSQIK